MPMHAKRRSKTRPGIFVGPAVLLAIVPLGCAAPLRPPEDAAPAEVASSAGVIVAIRALPRESAAAAVVGRAAGIAPSAAQGAGAAWEVIIVIDGRRPLSVVQGDAERLTLGERVRVLQGPPVRIAPAAA